MKEAAHETLVHEDGHLCIAKGRMAALLGIALPELHGEVVGHPAEGLLDLRPRPMPHVLTTSATAEASHSAAHDDAPHVRRAALNDLDNLGPASTAAQFLEVKAVGLLVAAEAHSHGLLRHAEEAQGTIASFPVKLGAWTPDDLSTPLVPVPRQSGLEEVPEVQCFWPLRPAPLLTHLLKELAGQVHVSSDRVLQESRHALCSTALGPRGHLDKLEVLFVDLVLPAIREEALKPRQAPPHLLCVLAVVVGAGTPLFAPDMRLLVVNAVLEMQLHLHSGLPNKLRAAGADDQLDLHVVSFVDPEVPGDALLPEFLHDLPLELRLATATGPASWQSQCTEAPGATDIEAALEGGSVKHLDTTQRVPHVGRLQVLRRPEGGQRAEVPLDLEKRMPVAAAVIHRRNGATVDRAETTQQLHVPGAPGRSDAGLDSLEPGRVLLEPEAQAPEDAVQLPAKLPKDRPALLELGLLLPPLLGPTKAVEDEELVLEVVEEPFALDLGIGLPPACGLSLPGLLHGLLQGR
mmetsp:Transcript_43230/g.92255  ORF Transcript_43230/g.92255 Transcript_43230/m.92255 type:complete len:520 (-) Transcript_43230:415-1974(-)